MDEGLSNAVKHVFVELYNKGLIYKGKKMINWCPYCKTSISDAEVEYEEEPTHLWHIKYKVKGEENMLLLQQLDQKQCLEIQELQYILQMKDIKT